MRNLTLLLAAALSLAVVGCKKDEPAPPTTSPMVSPTVTPTDSGAPTMSPTESPTAPMTGGDNAKVVGTWKFDANSIKLGATKPEDQKGIPAQTDAMKKSMDGSTITFSADGTFSVSNPKGSPDTGKFTVNGNDIDMKDDKNSGPAPKATLSADGSKISFHMDNDRHTIDFDAVKS